jgi:hypothetical protein
VQPSPGFEDEWDLQTPCTYLTHRISDHFLFKADYIRYNYTWSGSGWHIGEPKRLDSNPILGFPGYDKASMFTMGLTAEF